MKPAFARLSSLRFLSISCLCGLVITLNACLTQTRSVQLEHNKEGMRATAAVLPPVNVNTASRDELEKLPGIGPGLATRIIEYRDRYGRFRRAEHLIMVRGLSHRRFLAMRSFVAVE